MLLGLGQRQSLQLAGSCGRPRGREEGTGQSSGRYGCWYLFEKRYMRAAVVPVGGGKVEILGKLVRELELGWG